MNDEGKIQLEETLNETVNDTHNTTTTDSDVVDDSSAFDESVTDGVRGPTAEVLSIDEHDTSTIYQNHLITNQINNNNNNTKSNDNSDDANVDESPSEVTEDSAIATDIAEQMTSSPTSTTTTTAIAENGLRSVVVEKPIGALNTPNNDAADAVGFCSHNSYRNSQERKEKRNILYMNR